MYDRNRNRKNDPKSVIIFLIIAVLFLLPTEVTAAIVGLAVLLAPFGFILWMALKNKKNRPGRTNQPRRQNQAFDDCPQPFFCFHWDKGEHHVRKGREIDPWDRPDIDISKYRRK